jgi:hypothetical protein
MNFDAYPFDVHVCPVEFTSINLQTDNLIFTGSSYYEDLQQRPTAFEVKIGKITEIFLFF